MQSPQPKSTPKPSRAKCILLWCIRHWKLLFFLGVAIAVALVVWKVKRLTDNGTPLLSVNHSTAIAQTPEEVQSLRNIKQWEFLAVETEELIEHHEAHTMGDKHLVNIYRGTLRIGIDMQKAPDDWFTADSTLSVTLRLPDVGLLDEKFIDEARTTTFHEQGSFSAQVKQNLYDQAANAMKTRTLTQENLAAAREAAEEQFTRIFTALGYSKVSISFIAAPNAPNSDSQKPDAPQDKDSSKSKDKK